MVNSIDILITNGLYCSLKAVIDYRDNVCYINDEKYIVSNDFLTKILSLIYLWKNEYGTLQGLDVEEFTINIYTDQGKETIHGKGKFPNNGYEELKELFKKLVNGYSISVLGGRQK